MCENLIIEGIKNTELGCHCACKIKCRYACSWALRKAFPSFGEAFLVNGYERSTPSVFFIFFAKILIFK
jgi:hypothetical protein